MRHWEHHRTRSKVALLLLINLVALLGGKYLALITIVKIELFGEASAFAKAPKKKFPKPHLGHAQRHPGEIIHVIRRGDTLSKIAASHGLSVDALRRANRLPHTGHLIVGDMLRIPSQPSSRATVESPQTSPDS